MTRSNNKKLDFVGIGATKCATTWIYECLAEHPDICMSNIKDTGFFSHDENYNKGLDYYFSTYYNQCKDNQIKGEFTTDYFNDKCAARFKENFPDIKILVCLRKPIDRSMSFFYHAKFDSHHDLKDFDDLIKADTNQILEDSLYAKRLKYYYELFGREKIKVLIYEDIKNDPVAFQQSIFKFLGVNDNFVPPSAEQVINPTNVKTSRIYKVFHFGVIDRIKKGPFGMRLYRSAYARKMYYNIIEKPVAKMSKSLPDIKPETREHLNQYYKDDIEQMEKLIGRNLDCWK
ncbi:sulfotransferase domain-containing protein [Patescibacteria group bacterium]|nr:sulfotransferase domain-containing protein [Patescibacteria group bacterium]MBU1673237.1 sulfotransferase domain-containing protein [Patescibacteria group bacterium]MBU1964005.1 sulfotransferase domain-containing protein [Patescibacteria group bacterium]